MHKHSDSHRAYTAGDGGDIGCLLGAGIEIKVTDELIAYTVYTHVDKNRTLFYHIAGYHTGLTASGNEYIGVLGEGSEVCGTRMTYRNGSVFGEKKRTHRLTDDIATSDNDAILARNRNSRFVYKTHNARRSAGLEAGCTGKELSDVICVERVYVFVGADCLDNSVGVYLLGNGHLNEDAVDIVVLVEEIDKL